MKQVQNTSVVLMISPTCFGFNEEAFKTNSFQNRPQKDEESINELAKQEFDAFVRDLENLGVTVLVAGDFPNSRTPDSIFPNNWFSTHSDGNLVLYPMAVKNRRKERRDDLIEDLMIKNSYQKVDLTYFESEELAYLEGTGSLVLDRDKKVAFAAISPRTDEKVLEEFCRRMKYQKVCFKAIGKDQEEIYHTNVMMCIADQFVLIGFDTIAEDQREFVRKSVGDLGKEVIELSNHQIYEEFAGNMLQLINENDESILVMSEKAYAGLSKDQLARLTFLNDHILAVKIPTIERIGGGSVRCMLAEIFTAPKMEEC
ncbi:MAG: arginine deiminase-related protein [Crocinitomicaceae bacterium]|nr:arginine deiminase-related protein [Crocinitomicaceae bacterium]